MRPKRAWTGEFEMKAIVVVALACFAWTGCVSKSRYIDPHIALNLTNASEIRKLFAAQPYDYDLKSLVVDDSHWVVVTSYPYRALNRFDVYVFEHPSGGLSGYEYGYYFRAFLVASHSQEMRVEIRPEGDGIRVLVGDAILASIGHLRLGSSNLGSRAVQPHLATPANPKPPTNSPTPRSP